LPRTVGEDATGQADFIAGNPLTFSVKSHHETVDG
jgi:hypothetical protein